MRLGQQSVNERAWACLVLHGLLTLARGLLRGDNGLQRLAQALPVAPGTLDLSLSLGRRGIGGLASSHPSCARQAERQCSPPTYPIRSASTSASSWVPCSRKPATACKFVARHVIL